MTGAGGSNVAIGVLAATTTGGTAVSLNGPLTFGVSGATSTIAATAGAGVRGRQQRAGCHAALGGVQRVGHHRCLAHHHHRNVHGHRHRHHHGQRRCHRLAGRGWAWCSAPRRGVSLANMTVDADADTGMTISGGQHRVARQPRGHSDRQRRDRHHGHRPHGHARHRRRHHRRRGPRARHARVGGHREPERDADLQRPRHRDRDHAHGVAHSSGAGGLGFRDRERGRGADGAPASSPTVPRTPRRCR
jgi:hypothetical protein